MRIRSQEILIFALVLSICLADNAATIATFKARTGMSEWAVQWVVKQADHDACIAAGGQCCFNAGTYTPTSSENDGIISFTGTVTGTCQGTTLIMNFGGWNDANSLLQNGNVAALVYFEDNISTSFVQQNDVSSNSSDLIVFDNSSATPPSYGILLPSNHNTYSSTEAFNKLWMNLPDETPTPVPEPTPTPNPTPTPTPETTKDNQNTASTSALVLVASSVATLVSFIL